MNREDCRKYWNQNQQRFQSKGSKKKAFKSYRGNHKKQWFHDWIKNQQIYGSRSSKSRNKQFSRRIEPSRPPSPLPGSEEYTQRKIQKKSEFLKKQMAECPDNDIVLSPPPDRPSESRNVSESIDDYHNDRIIPAIGYLQAALDSTAAELSNIKKKAKKTHSRSSESNPSAEEISEAILVRIANMRYQKKFDLVHQNSEICDRATRHLQRQQRINASRELKNMKSNNKNNCATLNAIIPDYVTKLEQMPQNFLAQISSTIDLELNEDFLYDAADQSTYDNVGSLHNSDNNSQSQFENQCSDNNSLDNNSEIMEEQDHVQECKRTVTCHVQSTSMDSEVSGNVKSEAIVVDTSPDDSQNSLYDPHQETTYSSPSETPPAPYISDICTLLGHPDNNKRDQELETRKIRVIAEASEDFHKYDCEESQESQDTSARETPEEDNNKYERPDGNSNGYNHVLDEADMAEDIKFRKNYDLRVEDDWNRNVIIKQGDNEHCGKVVLNKVTKCDSFEPPGELKKESCDMTKVQNGIKEDTNVTATDAWKPTCEVDLPKDPTDERGDDQTIQSQTADLPETDAQTSTDLQSEKTDRGKNLYEMKPDCTSILVLEATSKPGTFKLKKSKLITEHMYCKKFSPVNNDNGEQLKSKPSNISEAIQTESTEVKPRFNPRSGRRNWKRFRTKPVKYRKPKHKRKIISKAQAELISREGALKYTSELINKEDATHQALQTDPDPSNSNNLEPISQEGIKESNKFLHPDQLINFPARAKNFDTGEEPNKSDHPILSCDPATENMRIKLDSMDSESNGISIGISQNIQTDPAPIISDHYQPAKVGRNTQDQEIQTEAEPNDKSTNNTNQEIQTDLDPNHTGTNTTNQEIQTDPEYLKPTKRLSTSEKQRREIRTHPEHMSGLRQSFSTYKRKTRHMLKQLNVIDKKIEDLMNERRELQKAFDAFASSDESEEEVNQPAKKAKKVPVYYITTEGGPEDPNLNPVLNSVPPPNHMLTRIGNNEPTPDSLPDFLVHALDMDIFSMMTESQTKVQFSGAGETSVSAGIGEIEMDDEQFSSVTGDGSATGMESIDMAESSPFTEDNADMTETTEIEVFNELQIPNVVSKTVPADILEPNDNKSMNDTSSKNPNDLMNLSTGRDMVGGEHTNYGIANNNVKIEAADIFAMDELDSDVISEFVGSEVQVDSEPVDTTIDFVGWNEAIIVVKVIENIIVAGNNKGKLLYFDVDSPYPLYSELLSSKAITSICTWKNDNHVQLFIGSLNSELYVYDFHARKVERSIPVVAPIQCLEMGWTGLYLGSSKGQLIGFCVNTSRLSKPVSISRDAILAIKALQEGPRRVLLVATRNSPVSIHDASTGLLLRVIGAQMNPTVYSLVFHNNRIYCGTSHDDVLAFNFQDGSFMFKHSEPGGTGVICMTTLRHLLFVACYNGNIYVYDTENNSFITSMSAPRGLFLCMAVTDTKLIAGTKQSFQCMPLPETVLDLL